MMKKRTTPLSLFLFFLMIAPVSVVCAQDLMKELEEHEQDKKMPVEATFKGTRIVNGHSVEAKGKGELEFIIAHRFGRLNSGLYNLFGLDAAFIRIGLEYGISDRLIAGVGRNSFNKIYDGYLKYRVVRQSTGPGSSPISITAFGSTAIQTVTRKSDDPTIEFSDRLTYTMQALIARKFSPRFSLQLMPTYVHSNRVNQAILNNGQLALGVGGRYKITRSVAINTEYYYRVNPIANSPYYNSIGIGVDIETGGHVFQLILSNTQGMVERTFITETAGDFFNGDIHFGFNITRVFQLKKPE
jgi:hypothetical protein